jgi:hypothetical protein
MKKLLNIDLHISVIADIINVFKQVDENIQIEDWSLSGHTWVLNKETKKLDILNSGTWKNLDMRMIHIFQEKYDTIFKTFDGFICCYPVSFILFFEKYNKPIYIVNAVRYDMPFCWNNNHNMIDELHNSFTRLQEKKLLTFISNNKADNDYFKLGNPNIKTQIIPSLCLYTNMRWNPAKTNNKFLMYSGDLPSKKINITKRSELGQFNWTTLMEFKGIVHLPYEASTMSIFEQISSEIPLFFPSKSFLKILWEENRINHQMNYWKHNNGNTPSYLVQTNNCNFWIERADYYDIEGIYFFDSFEHLYQILENFKDELYEIRKEFIRNRKIKVLTDYSNLLKVIFN